MGKASISVVPVVSLDMGRGSRLETRRLTTVGRWDEDAGRQEGEDGRTAGPSGVCCVGTHYCYFTLPTYLLTLLTYLLTHTRNKKKTSGSPIVTFARQTRLEARDSSLGDRGTVRRRCRTAGRLHFDTHVANATGRQDGGTRACVVLVPIVFTLLTLLILLALPILLTLLT